MRCATLRHNCAGVSARFDHRDIYIQKLMSLAFVYLLYLCNHEEKFEFEFGPWYAIYLYTHH